MVDIVGAEPGAHQFLEQISFLVRSLGRTKTGERLDALFVADLYETLGGDIEGLFPARLAKMREGIGGIDLVVGILLGARQAHQRFCQAMRVMDVVEAETAFYAQAVMIGRAVAALRIN